MRIGFDVSQTGTRKAGCGCVADSLVLELASIDRRNQYILYPTFGDSFWDAGGPQATRRIDRPNFRVAPAHDSLEAARDFWRRPPADLDERLGAPDVVHSHNFFCPTGLRRARLVYTLHDLSFLVHPEWTTELNRQVCFEGVFNAGLHADLILAVSEHSRRHFLELFPHYPPARTGVIYWASRFENATPVERPASLSRGPASRLASERFLLFVGTLEPRKNPARLLRAYAGYAEGRPDPLPLVLAGGSGWLVEDLERQLAAPGLADRVHRLGYVGDEELRWLYQSCFAFVYPSLFEGFGLPVVEAMSQGAAVITSRVSSLPEVVGDAGLLVDPTDEGELRRAIERLAGDPGLRTRLRDVARAAASRFSWRQTAEKVLAFYEDVAAVEKYSPHCR